MSYNKDKLWSFQQAILSETTDKIMQLEQEVKDYEKSEISKARELEYGRMFTYMQEQVQFIKAKHRQEGTKYQLDSKRELLLFRNQLSEQVFEKVKQKLLAFAGSGEYVNYLMNEIAAAFEEFPCDTATVLLAKKDLCFADAIKEKCPQITEIKADQKNHLGGFMLQNEAKGIVLDGTFVAALENETKLFYSSCGLSVHF